MSETPLLLPPGRPSRIRALLFPFALAAGYGAAFFVVNGALIERISSVAASYAAPFALPEGGIAYASLLGPLMGYALGIRGETTVIAFNAALVMLAIAALVAVAARLANDRAQAATLLALLALSPILEILTSWVGKPDPLIVLSYLLFAAAPGFLLRNAGAFFLLLAHKETGLVMLVTHLLLFREWRQARAYLPGALLGLAWYALYAFVLGNPPDRISFVAGNLLEILENATHLPQFLLFSLGWLWLPILMLLREPQLRLRVIGALILVLGVTFLTIDVTRIAALLSLPLVLFLLRHHAAIGMRFPLPLLLFLAACSLFQLEWANSMLTVTHWHEWPLDQIRTWTERYLGAD